MEHQEKGFIRAKVKGVHLYTCYSSPSATLDEYELCALVWDARECGPIIIATGLLPATAGQQMCGNRESFDLIHFQSKATGNSSETVLRKSRLSQ